MAGLYWDLGEPGTPNDSSASPGRGDVAVNLPPNREAPAVL